MDIGLSEFIIAIIAASPSILLAIIQVEKWSAEAKKTKAETKQIELNAPGEITDSAIDLYRALSEENKRLRDLQGITEKALNETLRRTQERLEACEEKIDDHTEYRRVVLEKITKLEEHIIRLEDQLKKAGMTPTE